ncbi:hypothetical protein [Streptomyces physcomitrii]|uniref:Uncharacterized protein n=1 Tax=Streptomyces physcomitrii TaxID=2724184 RepID=A0ABX1H7T3_9ACTN|nr:hypothetical protein [Streptomyces physcomitrii]NKI43365.1 hypothetical protein [Streptomyces physcomitrii]
MGQPYGGGGVVQFGGHRGECLLAVGQLGGEQGSFGEERPEVPACGELVGGGGGAPQIPVEQHGQGRRVPLRVLGELAGVLVAEAGHPAAARTRRFDELCFQELPPYPLPRGLSSGQGAQQAVGELRGGVEAEGAVGVPGGRAEGLVRGRPDGAQGQLPGVPGLVVGAVGLVLVQGQGQHLQGGAPGPQAPGELFDAAAEGVGREHSRDPGGTRQPAQQADHRAHRLRRQALRSAREAQEEFGAGRLVEGADRQRRGPGGHRLAEPAEAAAAGEQDHALRMPGQQRADLAGPGHPVEQHQAGFRRGERPEMRRENLRYGRQLGPGDLQFGEEALQDGHRVRRARGARTEVVVEDAAGELPRPVGGVGPVREQSAGADAGRSGERGDQR